MGENLLEVFKFLRSPHSPGGGIGKTPESYSLAPELGICIRVLCIRFSCRFDVILHIRGKEDGLMDILFSLEANNTLLIDPKPVKQDAIYDETLNGHEFFNWCNCLLTIQGMFAGDDACAHG
ncbi:hypothetical protein VNO77_04445 [Canavalia gladiata]|uniref:Uncharacterized protein n=1 Tax=Canavalia gladiata TaxID=3824 RepID=A0AAN9MWI8_CANGL